MTQLQTEGKTTIAALPNVALCADAIRRSADRASHLPGIVCLYGPSGYGKTVAACYAANKFRGHYVECRSVWSRTSLLRAILATMGISPRHTVAGMTEQIAQELQVSSRPLLIDEADHIARAGHIEIVRDITESSRSPVLLIGEEQLPHKLLKWERVHNRVLAWVPAQPATLEDATELAKLYAPDVKFEEALLKRIRDISRGVTRRICINIDRVRQDSLGLGAAKAEVKNWPAERLYSGEPTGRVML